MPETTRHRQAFDAYWRLGAERSIERLHAALAAAGKAPTVRTLYEWSTRYRWQYQVADLERQARRAEKEVRIQALGDMYERQAKEGLLLQQRGTQWLAAMEGEDATADAAIRAVVEGARLERIAMGEPTDIQEVQDGQGNERLSELTDEEVDHLVELAEGDLGGEDEEGS